MYHKTISVIAMVVGLVFVFNPASDIQIGFGAVLLTIGLLNFKDRKCNCY